MVSLIDAIKNLFGQMSVSFNNTMIRISYGLTAAMKTLVLALGTLLQAFEMLKHSLSIA